MLRPLALLALMAPLLAALDPAAIRPTPGAAPICHADLGANDDEPSPAKAILTGYGTGGFRIVTASPEAQTFFDNGMQLAHAFAHRAATSAFMRAEELDPRCAMCVWGDAWSRGPTINYPIDRRQQTEAAALADKAAVLAQDNPAVERALIAALQVRYHEGGGAGPGDDGFARAMDVLATDHPGDSEIAVIAADAWMIPASARVYAQHRSPLAQHPSLLRARGLLLEVLRAHPEDTGAIHFYIHATENDGAGTLALPYAERLGALAPKASHLTHMPSHTFLWAGRFKMTEAANIEAVKIDRANAVRLKIKDGAFGLPYHAHNVQFGLGAALLDNDAEGALFLAADEAARAPAIKADDVYEQRVLGSAYFAYGRYADLKTVRALPDPGARLPLARTLRLYAIGEAAARANDPLAVAAAARAMEATPSFDALKDLGVDDRPAAQQVRDLSDVARLVLKGRAAILGRRYDDAVAAYGRAAVIEEARLATFKDPPAWWYPPRRSLAAALLAAGRRDAAAVEIRKVLIRWPYDPVSLRIAADAGAAADPRQTLIYANANWSGDIRTLPLALM